MARITVLASVARSKANPNGWERVSVEVADNATKEQKVQAMVAGAKQGDAILVNCTKEEAGPLGARALALARTAGYKGNVQSRPDGRVDGGVVLSISRNLSLDADFLPELG